jgi:hypothetical protein
VKIFRFFVLITILFLFSCFPKKPEIPGTRVPAGPFFLALEQQRKAVDTFTAIASVDVVRGAKKRSYDTVGIVFDARRRLRVEAFGPLGQSIVALVWDGQEVLVRLQDDGIKKPGQAGIERLLGIRMDAKELCAVLTGTVAEMAASQDAQAFCVQDGACVIVLRENENELVRYVHVLHAASSSSFIVTQQAVYRSGKMVYQVRYDHSETSSPGQLPTKLVIENPDKQVVLTVNYAEWELNAPVSEDAFTLVETPVPAGKS